MEFDHHERILVPTGTQTESSPTLPSFLPEKVIADLKLGYRLTWDEDYNYESLVMVTTRLEADLFTVQTDYSMQKPHPSLSEQFYRFECEVRRRRQIHPTPGSATREIWKARETSRHPLDLTYRIQEGNRGELDGIEFWRRYNLSVVDPDSTDQQVQNYLDSIKSRRAKARIVVTKVSEEPTPAQLDEPTVYP